jgi:hypothetical protein
MPSSNLFAVLCVVGLLAPIEVVAADLQPPADLVRLAVSLSDAIGQWNTARLKLQSATDLKQAPGGAVVGSMTVELAKVDVETAERKVLLLAEIVKIETEATERGLAVLRGQHESGRGDMGQIVRVEARQRTLQAIAKIIPGKPEK